MSFRWCFSSFLLTRVLDSHPTQWPSWCVLANSLKKRKKPSLNIFMSLHGYWVGMHVCAIHSRVFFCLSILGSRCTWLVLCMRVISVCEKNELLNRGVWDARAQDYNCEWKRQEPQKCRKYHKLEKDTVIWGKSYLSMVTDTQMCLCGNDTNPSAG